jgi:Protein of unknown function (DUF742)
MTVSPGDGWRRRDSGPVVRPYAVTGGRTEPAAGEVLDLITVVAATGQSLDAAERMQLTPEHQKILALCRNQVTLADLGADLGLPVGVVRVLLADLIEQGVVAVVPKRPAGERGGNDVLREILNGLRAL